MHMWYSNLWKIVHRATLKAWMYLTSSLSGLEIFSGSNYRGSICPTAAKIGSSYREFREIGGEIIELEWSKFNGNKVWFEISEAIFAPVGPRNSWEHKGWVESNRLFYVYRIDSDDVSKRLQFVSNRLASKRLVSKLLCIEMTELRCDNMQMLQKDLF